MRDITKLRPVNLKCGWHWCCEPCGGTKTSNKNKKWKWLCHCVFCLFVLILLSQSTIFQSCWDGSSLNQYWAADKVSCSRTQHSDSAGGETRTSNPSIPSLTLYHLSHCAPLALCSSILMPHSVHMEKFTFILLFCLFHLNIIEQEPICVASSKSLLLAFALSPIIIRFISINMNR